jgi:hypothetical protein
MDEILAITINSSALLAESIFISLANRAIGGSRHTEEPEQEYDVYDAAGNLVPDGSGDFDGELRVPRGYKKTQEN